MRKRLLLQAGHVAPREPGFPAVGTDGEQELVSAIQSRLGKLLAADLRFDVTLCPGAIPDNWNGDLFLSLHADGSRYRQSSGFSFGFPPGCSECKRLADTFAAWYVQIPGAPNRRRDNYTTALSGYYGWRRTFAPAKLLVEHGFLTNPGERAWLLGNVQQIAQAHYEAVLHYFRLEWPESPARNRKRLKVLRSWIVKRRKAGWGWGRLKRTHNWKEWRRRGGR
ncbi:MAG: N-acetylmuramoyl-L-alanine amidase [Gemmatimonadaceae bacterium]|nr:N-acetylmuramoyl-L-alanine amidase [Gemmatimonadaceae bacterium]